jgi:hypothetical protein
MSDKLIFNCDIYDLLIEKIVNRLTTFIKYNPDDLNKKILEKIIKSSIAEISNQSLEKVDKNFEAYAKIRIYMDTKKGAFLKSNDFNIYLPDFDKGKLNDIDIENCYVKAFFSKMQDIILVNDTLQNLINQDNYERLKGILKECNEFANNAAIYKISSQKNP